MEHRNNVNLFLFIQLAKVNNNKMNEKRRQEYSFVWRATWLCIIFWQHYEMMENNHAHSTAMSAIVNKLTVSTKYFWEKKTFERQKLTLWNKFAMKIKFWHTWRLLQLHNPGAQGEHVTHQPAFTAFTSQVFALST